MLTTIAPVFAAFVLAAGPLQVEADVAEIQTKSFKMPIAVDAAQREQIDRIRLFVSRDRGKTWEHAKDYDVTANAAEFHAAEDGLYWFAVQVIEKNGTASPRDSKQLQPAMKVYVNSARRA